MANSTFSPALCAGYACCDRKRPIKVNVMADTSAVIVGFNLHFATSAKAEIMGLYKM
ncbi:MAG: hypothetical protein WB760_14800 [Xanthobacteraceae bacterium]